jgi:hypothetical protein
VVAVLLVVVGPAGPTTTNRTENSKLIIHVALSADYVMGRSNVPLLLQTQTFSLLTGSILFKNV